MVKVGSEKNDDLVLEFVEDLLSLVTILNEKEIDSEGSNNCTEKLNAICGRNLTHVSRYNFGAFLTIFSVSSLISVMRNVSSLIG